MEANCALLVIFKEFVTIDMFKKNVIRDSRTGGISSRMGDQGGFFRRKEHLRDHDGESIHSL